MWPHSVDAYAGSQGGSRGAEEEVTRSLEEYQQAGVTHVLLDLLYSAPELHQETVDSVLKTMERFAEGVMPRLEG